MSQNKGDRNFHIFYQLLSAAFPNALRKSLGIDKQACDYRFLNQGGECHDHGIDDATIGMETDVNFSKFLKIGKNFMFAKIYFIHLYHNENVEFL